MYCVVIRIWGLRYSPQHSGTWLSFVVVIAIVIHVDAVAPCISCCLEFDARNSELCGTRMGWQSPVSSGGQINEMKILVSSFSHALSLPLVCCRFPTGMFMWRWWGRDVLCIYGFR